MSSFRRFEETVPQDFEGVEWQKLYHKDWLYRLCEAQTTPSDLGGLSTLRSPSLSEIDSRYQCQVPSTLSYRAVAASTCIYRIYTEGSPSRAHAPRHRVHHNLADAHYCKLASSARICIYSCIVRTKWVPVCAGTPSQDHSKALMKLLRYPSLPMLCMTRR
jgi:hypothetical protein